MEAAGFSYLVTAEFGADWARHVEDNGDRFERVVSLIQAHDESLIDFARRVRAKLSELGRIAGATVLCTDTCTREALAERTTVLDGCAAAMRGVARRELSLFLPSGRNGGLPHWAAPLIRGIEERDPGIELLVQCDERVQAA
jgi:hypothetical protein